MSLKISKCLPKPANVSKCLQMSPKAASTGISHPPTVFTFFSDSKSVSSFFLSFLLSSCPLGSLPKLPKPPDVSKNPQMPPNVSNNLPKFPTISKCLQNLQTAGYFAIYSFGWTYFLLVTPKATLQLHKTDCGATISALLYCYIGINYPDYPATVSGLLH